MSLIDQLTERREELRTRAERIVGRAESSGRDLTDIELSQLRATRTELDGVEDRIAEVAEHNERQRRAANADASPDRNRERATAAVTSEPRTYRPTGPHSFFGDAFRMRFLGDMQAHERLARHTQEVVVEREASAREQRDVGTGAFGGLVVPQHLVDEYASVLRNGRAFANAVRRLPLPREGMTLIVPRGETGSTVAAQAAEHDAVSEQDVDFDNDLSVPVRTFAGQQDVSRQALERGTPGLDALVYADLVADYAAKLDSSVLNDDGTAGTHTGLENLTGENVVTWTEATPTVALFWPKLADAVAQVASNRRQGANLIAMHPRRWAWIIAAVDAQERPLVIHGNASDAVNAMGAAAADFGEGQLVGTLQGLPVIVDGNVVTDAGGDQDVVYVLRRSDPILWEEGDGLPRQLRFDEPGAATLTVKLLVYGYSAFTAERYASGVSRITGTGLIAPTF